MAGGVRPPRAQRQCGSKKAHRSDVAAMGAALAFEQKFKQPMQAYRCPWCSWWHIGHKIEGKSKA